MDKRSKNTRIKTVDDFKKIKEDGQVIEVTINDVDDNLNLHCSFTDNIKGVIPREEVSSIVDEETGEVPEKESLNKKDRRIQVQIKDIIERDDGSVEVILSKRAVEYKVRKWMYMHLKPGMKLKGVVRNITQYGVFIDVGAGVTRSPKDRRYICG